MSLAEIEWMAWAWDREEARRLKSAAATTATAVSAGFGDRDARRFLNRHGSQE